MASVLESDALLLVKAPTSDDGCVMVKVIFGAVSKVIFGSAKLHFDDESWGHPGAWCQHWRV